MFYENIDLYNEEIYLKLQQTSMGIKIKMYVPSYYFKICRRTDDAEIGKCDLRIGHNENTLYAGNIGYEVYEEYRGNHYAGKACLLLLELARLHGLGYLIITCAVENTASRKTCEYCNAKLSGIVDIPSWHEMYRMGRRKSCQYEIILKEIPSGTSVVSS